MATRTIHRSAAPTSRPSPAPHVEPVPLAKAEAAPERARGAGGGAVVADRRPAQQVQEDPAPQAGVDARHAPEPEAPHGGVEDHRARDDDPGAVRLEAAAPLLEAHGREV